MEKQTLGGFLNKEEIMVKCIDDSEYLDVRVGCSFCCAGIACGIKYDPVKPGTMNICELSIYDLDARIDWPMYRITTDKAEIIDLYLLRNKLIDAHSMRVPITFSTYDDSYMDTGRSPVVCGSGSGISSDIAHDFTGKKPKLDSIKEVHICNVCYGWIIATDNNNQWLRRLPKIHGKYIFWFDLAQQLVEKGWLGTALVDLTDEQKKEIITLAQEGLKKVCIYCPDDDPDDEDSDVLVNDSD